MTDDDLEREYVTTAEAARLLGLEASHVRLLVRTQAMAGERLGKTWFVPRSAVAAYRAGSHEVGRPFSQRIAWSLLAAKEGMAAPWQLHRQERARLKAYATRPLGALAQRLGGRATTVRLSVGPKVFERLAEHPRWLMGGLSGQSVPDVAIVYVPASRYDAVLDDTNAVADREQPNLLVKVVSDQWWPFGEARRGAPVWNVVAELDRFERARGVLSTEDDVSR